MSLLKRKRGLLIFVSGLAPISRVRCAAYETRKARRPHTYSLTDCMTLWDAKTHMTKGQWRAACARVQSRLNNLEVIAEDTGTTKTPKKRESGLGGDRRTN